MRNMQNLEFFLIHITVVLVRVTAFIISFFGAWEVLLLLCFLFFLHKLVFLLYFQLKFLTGKFCYLGNFLLAVENCHKGTLLSNFKKVDVKVLFLNWSITHTKFHEKVLEQNLLWIVKIRYSHSKHPKSNSDIEELPFS